MDHSIRALEWKRADDDAPTDVTDAIAAGVVSATPHPDDNIDHPKGYSVKLTLRPDGAAFADALQEAMLDLDPPTVTIRLDDVDEVISDVPVGVSKVPHLGEQNEAELSVKPEGHDQLHGYF
ncbi:hypothetical protein BSZ35_07760 [Salinibacter sp. 10B]|uniref:hypothetical protein n=1 Tax=Salinibacter sp. 10B TaxID=1923971 RepID=UPI000CF3F197|nr:hypothetical protein [Salinibacter sp. 10B]PQJ34505.1 hypothetical protein BSZ35_07760 [Salinibacter sp. 10B]